MRRSVTRVSKMFMMAKGRKRVSWRRQALNSAAATKIVSARITFPAPQLSG